MSSEVIDVSKKVSISVGLGAVGATLLDLFFQYFDLLQSTVLGMVPTGYAAVAGAALGLVYQIVKLVKAKKS